MFTRLFSANIQGIEAQQISVEIDMSLGFLQWHIVGLPDLAVKESKERISAAIKNSGIKLPERKITINLSPADLKKRGSLFDLPIILGLLDAAKIITIPEYIKEESLFIGEISLDGTLVDAKGALSIASDLKKMNKKYLFIPHSKQSEVSLIDDIYIFAPKNIQECVHWFLSNQLEAKHSNSIEKPKKQNRRSDSFDDVLGNEKAKRALQIGVAGHHATLLIGSPGSGKTFLAEKTRNILPPMTHEEQIEVTKIYSASGLLAHEELIEERPFLAPHHSISTTGLIGGGSIPKPGMISLAHKGILFLDELLEYKKQALESLRQPLESKEIKIARAQAEAKFPADFLLIAATNPCPCGYYGDKRKTCSCSEIQIKQYMQKLSGPLLDRIDLHIPVFSQTELPKKHISAIETTKKFHDALEHALKRQANRFGSSTKRNTHLSSKDIEFICKINNKAKEKLEELYKTMNLSMRGYFKIIKIAQTIADLEDSDTIELHHIFEAISYRVLDRI
jgi:magnesium chelatase family protein